MVQKQAVRSRSKSSSRKSKTEGETTSKPIVETRRKSVKNEENKDVYRRITRQSIRDTECSSLDDWKLDEPFVYLTDAKLLEGKETESNNRPTTDSNDFVHKKSQNTWFKTIVESLFSFFFVLIVPLLVILLNKMCENGGRLRIIYSNEIKGEYFLNWIVISFVLMWLLFLSLLSVLPIGGSRSVSLTHGFQLRYRCNGILSLLVSTGALLWLIHSKKLTTKLIYDNYYPLIGSSITLAFLISFVIYLKSFLKKTASVDNSGNVLSSFMKGREINPRILGLDLKYFYEFRPGLISWALLNIIFCIKDLEDNEFQFINPSLLLCATCQFLYCFDSLLFEGDVILKSFMVSGRFGFIHCFGNQVIVPFLFSMTSRTIQINKLTLPNTCITCIAVLNFVGYVIYRSSNTQKNEFRRNPYSTHLSHLKTITTEHGQQLLAGGWWGLVRHPNYSGDILMSICWSLCSGSNLMVCWFYPIYFAIFIVNRCLQDESICAHKHGKGWTEYKTVVRYRMLPFVF